MQPQRNGRRKGVVMMAFAALIWIAVMVFVAVVRVLARPAGAIIGLMMVVPWIVFYLSYVAITSPQHGVMAYFRNRTNQRKGV